MLEKVISFSHNLIKSKINNNSICVDMTCGRGNDTLFMASISNKVYAFDIQLDAINSSKELCKDYNNIVFINDSHENVLNYVSEDINIAIFNLGYLPKGNKQITTKKDVTINALKNLLTKLSKDGLIVIICYPGHPEGYIEGLEVTNFIKSLNQKEYDCIKYEFVNQINNPPYVYAINKL